MEYIYAKAAGQFLIYYYGDLAYIENFQKFKNGHITTEQFLKKESGTLRSFLNEYRIARNIDKTKVYDFATEMKKWINKNSVHNVNEFAEYLKSCGYTHDKSMVSLCSKILFLNNPWENFPMDTLTKKALKIRENNYDKYQTSLRNFKQNNDSDLQLSLRYLKPFYKAIEKDFESKLNNIGAIRMNRYLDKVLWVMGNN